MGDVIHPHLPQWERNAENQDINDDAVLSLVKQLMDCLHTGVEPDVVVLAALRMVLKAVILNHQRNAGKEATQEALRQATELAAQYTIGGVGIDDDR
jgi:hypothetical protein